jgi:hypothetical protein
VSGLFANRFLLTNRAAYFVVASSTDQKTNVGCVRFISPIKRLIRAPHRKVLYRPLGQTGSEAVMKAENIVPMAQAS